ncbi:trypsin-like peptidase domain-containing protein [Litoribrevibacter euphylliae]|uniref:Trypsin-like peptidase domain-containing protein n=1 Tax=Litoribrevibacter euphylliae TaxID=1834034 RepID=A0ABV7HP99_9GAMM
MSSDKAKITKRKIKNVKARRDVKRARARKMRNKNDSSYDSSLQKWKKAVVHLECATDSEHFYDRKKRMDELRQSLDSGEITHEDFAKEISGRSRDLRYHGTALFIIHNDRRYLLTARHVLFDQVSSDRELREEQERASEWPEHSREFILQRANEAALNNVFNIIFRVPSIDEVQSDGIDCNREFLMNLGAGTTSGAPYTFSNPDLDLALVSLDQRDKRFADQLIELGYKPIQSSLIADAPISEGSEVFTVGFPSATAVLGQVSQHPASAHWSSSHFSLPVFSWGKVSMLHENLPFYWCDMSIYPGNSGGPIIEDGKLVGIVSAQATLPIDDAPQVRTRIPFGKIIKTSFVKELLEIQEQKDRN